MPVGRVLGFPLPEPSRWFRAEACATRRVLAAEACSSCVYQPPTFDSRPCPRKLTPHQPFLSEILVPLEPTRCLPSGKRAAVGPPGLLRAPPAGVAGRQRQELRCSRHEGWVGNHARRLTPVLFF